MDYSPRYYKTQLLSRLVTLSSIGVDGGKKNDQQRGLLSTFLHFLFQII
jgi:hypothetical protein